MQYIEKFSAQWDKLISDFTVEIGKKRAEEITAEAANKWYRTRIHRWNSIVETEGLVLEHENAPELKEALLTEMGSFSFAEPKLYKKPSFMLRIAIGTGLIILLSILPVILFDIGKLKAVFAAVLIIGVMLAEYRSKVNSVFQKAQKYIMNTYIEQLKDCKKRLVEICKSHSK